MATVKTVAVPRLEEQKIDGSKSKSVASTSSASVKTQHEGPLSTVPPKSSSHSLNSQVQKQQLQYVKMAGSREIEDEDFYHGYMTRSEAERLLTERGQYLVRRTDVKGEHCYVLSVKDLEKVKHLKIRQTRRRGCYWLHGFCFDSIGALISYHRRHSLPVHAASPASSNGDGLQLSGSHIKREQWELYHEQVDLSGGRLGSGEFGEVMAGFLTRGLFGRPVPVAVKTLRGSNMSSDDRVTFLREANVMLKLSHPHIVRLYGVATQRQPIMIVMERASGGSLLSRLKKETVQPAAKETFCHEIVDGMAYLEQQQVIHRDLAARNVLLSGSSCKISDFGLSLLGKMHRESKLSKVPVRWLAPETLTQGVYSSKTDVWSFGVVVYEIFTDGGRPYDEIKKLSMVALRVQQGLRLVLPDSTPSNCKEMARCCFEADPDMRASFGDLRQDFASTRSLRLKLKGLFSK